MLKKLESTELIACLAKYKEETEKRKNVHIKLVNLAKVARNMEAYYPPICVDIDKYSIESFRLSCIKAITVTQTEIKLNLENQHLNQIITRYNPSPKYRSQIIHVFEDIK